MSVFFNECETQVKSVMRRGQQGQVAQYKTAVVEYKDIYKLAPGTWLNDEASLCVRVFSLALEAR